jgi:hypothetical protein
LQKFANKTISVHDSKPDTIQKNTKALLDVSKEVGGLDGNPEKTKYMLICCQKAGHRHNIKIANRSLEDVAKFKYLGTVLTDQNCVHEEIKMRLYLCLLPFGSEPSNMVKI